MNYTEVLEEFVHPQKGVFKKVIPVPREAEDPDVFFHVCIPNQQYLQENGYGKWGELVGGGGAGYEEASSIKATLGEGLERYSAITYGIKQNNARLARWKDLSCPHAPLPETYILFSESQYQTPGFRYSPFTRESPVNWIKVRNETAKEDTYAPAALVFFAYHREESETRVAPGLTTGLALGDSREETLIKAIYEVVERDALALAWNWSLPVKKIEAAEYAEALRKQANLGTECRIHLYDITQDIPIPVAMVFLTRPEPEGYRMMVGSAARSTIHEAIAKAFLEAIQGFPYIRSLRRRFSDWKEVKNFDEVCSFRHSAVFYSKFPQFLGERMARGSFLTAPQTVTLHGPQPQQSVDMTTELDLAVEILKQRGYEVLSFDLTVERVRRQNLCVYRALVPGLLGLEGSYRYRYRDPRRAQRAAEALMGSFQENMLPHPLP